MPNETPLSTNTAFINFTSDYEYVLGATMGRLLDIQGMFHSMDFTLEQMQQIRFDLEDTAKLYAEQQGLAPGDIGWGIDGYNLDGTPMQRVNTGTLYHGIKAVKTGQTIHLKSEARDKYGHYYGGHVEFGHGTVPARPHLRPALYTVSQASQGLLRSALFNLLVGGFNGNLRMAFGTGGGRSASYYRKGVGEIGRQLSRGPSGRMAKYHFGSIRNNNGRNISRKAQTFRNSFSSTAKKSMGWGKQKSLNAAQAKHYRDKNSRGGMRRRSGVNQRGMNVRRSGLSSRTYRGLKSGSIAPVHTARGRSFNSQKARSEWKNYKTQRANQKRRETLARKQINNYYGKGEGRFKTGIAGQKFMQSQSVKEAQKQSQIKTESQKLERAFSRVRK